MTSTSRSPTPRILNPALFRIYPEAAFGGFSRFDGTVAFCARVQALLLEAGTGVVLDVGCGRASRVADPSRYRRDLQDLRGKAGKVVGIDLDPEASENPYLDEFRPMTPGAAWPVGSGEVALVYCDYVLEHVEAPEAFFDEIARVLRPGGFACLRTPNRWGYVAVAARLIPERRHLRVLTSANRYTARSEPRDVFPAYYRCNTPHALGAAFRSRGLAAAIWTGESEPSYFGFSRTAYRLAAIAHRWIPAPLRNSLIAFAKKPE